MLFFETSLLTGKNVFLDLIEGANVGVVVSDDGDDDDGEATDRALSTTTTPAEVS